MISFTQPHAVRLAFGKLGFSFRASNLDDLAYLLGYLDQVNYKSVLSLEIDFKYNAGNLCFDSLSSANAFLDAWKAEQASTTANPPIVQP